jgi:hypothetical protein
MLPATPVSHHTCTFLRLLLQYPTATEFHCKFGLSSLSSSSIESSEEQACGYPALTAPLSFDVGFVPLLWFTSDEMGPDKARELSAP